jgi:hypothetical protein
MKQHIDIEQITAIMATICITLSLACQYLMPGMKPYHLYPLYFILAVGGTPLILGILRKIWAKDFGADMLAGISIITAALLEQYLA